jgi:hypothetical protein
VEWCIGTNRRARSVLAPGVSNPETPPWRRSGPKAFHSPLYEAFEVKHYLYTAWQAHCPSGT